MFFVEDGDDGGAGERVRLPSSTILPPSEQQALVPVFGYPITFLEHRGFHLEKIGIQKVKASAAAP